MTPGQVRSKLMLGVLTCLLGWSAIAQAGSIKLAIVHADTDASAQGAQAALMATGLFGQIDLYDSTIAGVPSLSDLQNYDTVLAYSNYDPDDPVALGDVLADFVDLGGRGLVLATYGFAGSTLGVSGRIAQTGYSPFVIPAPDSDVSGQIVAEAGQSGDPIFSGVNLGALQYYHTGQFANPTLDTGATLLATDGAGVNLIARNQSGSVLGLNLFPGSEPGVNNTEFYKLLGNSLASTLPPVSAVPEPASVILAGQSVIIPILVLLTRARRNPRRG